MSSRRRNVIVLGRSYSGRYAILFYLLLLTLGAGPLLEALGLGSNILELLLIANLFAAVIPIDDPKRRRVLLILLTVALAARLGAAWFNHPTISRVSLAMWTVVALAAAAGALRYSLRATAVSSEHLYAACPKVRWRAASPSSRTSLGKSISP